MMKNIYIDWDNERVVANPDKWIKERAQEIQEDVDELAEFLHHNTTMVDMFYMSSDERAELVDQWENESLNLAEDEFGDYFEEYDLEAMEAEEFALTPEALLGAII